MHLRSLAIAAALAGAVLLASGCGRGDVAAGSPFEPAKPDVLTVATAFLPAPGFWQGDAEPYGGFEAGLARALAERLGLHRVAVVQVPFAEIVRGRLHGADLALSQLTPTEEREHSLDFTTTYLSARAGVLALRKVEASDTEGLRKLHWVISRVSTLTPTVLHRIRPLDEPVVTEDRSGALEILRAGLADALLLDLPVALGLARSEPENFHVIGQLSGGEGLAAALPDGSPNREIVDSELRHLQADGTIDDLARRWLGTSADDVPLIRTEED